MFEEWYLKDLISEKIRKIWKLTDYYLLKLISNILEETGMAELLKSPISIREMISQMSYPEKVYNSIKWMLNRLKLDGYIRSEGQGKEELFSLTEKVVNYNLEETLNKAVAEAPDSVAAFNMLKLMADNYPDYLSGKKTGVDIIFSPENIDIINEYYSNNLFYNVHNIGGAKIVNWAAEKLDNPAILEIGGGLGGGTKRFIQQRIDEELSLDNFTYHFTDVANKMLRVTKKMVKSMTDSRENFLFQKFDFNTPFAEQGFAENSLDIIWGVNATHVATDLRFTLTEMRKALKPGGSLIISETVRPIGNTMIQQEFLLNTLDDYWNVGLDKEIRPGHGFMLWSDWVNALKLTGFSNVETIPDMTTLEKQYDNCYVAIIRGVKA